jgi:hypothetical protein
MTILCGEGCEVLLDRILTINLHKERHLVKSSEAMIEEILSE